MQTQTLSYSSQAPGRSPLSPSLRAGLVVAAGLVTTVLFLGGFALLAATVPDFNVMGWYILFVIPVGAMIVGFCAGSGYGLASWLSGRKISGVVLGVVLVLQVGAYAGAQWLEFASYEITDQAGRPLDFWTYYDATTRAIAFESTRGGGSTGELGLLGYGVRLLELVGFALGGIYAPAILRSKPYCDPCESYMRTRQLATLPAAVPTRKIARKDAAGREAYEAEMTTALEQGVQSVETILRAGESGDAGAIRGVFEPHPGQKKENEKLLHRIQVFLSSCVHCRTGVLSCSLVSGQRNQISTKELAVVPVRPEVTTSLA